MHRGLRPSLLCGASQEEAWGRAAAHHGAQSFAVCSGDVPELPRSELNSKLALMQSLGSALCESKIMSIISLLF